jgi:hypothetical protein
MIIGRVGTLFWTPNLTQILVKIVVSNSKKLECLNTNMYVCARARGVVEKNKAQARDRESERASDL